MEDNLLKEARARGYADQRGLYISASVAVDEKPLGRVWAFLNGSVLTLAELEFPAGLGLGLRSVELGGAKAEVKRFLIPFSLRLETAQGCLSFQAFRGAKAFLAAVETACQAEPAVPT
ncbi:MAG: hypothetical protein IJK24_00775 [Oscillospiraceae bacterium]|nr:hypothetical protein [Oscillospiraceae bacterium]